MLENIIKASESAIANFRSSCQALESSLIKSTGEILESTLMAMNKNGLLVEKENRKIIENESMVLNQVFFANNRTCSKILKALATDHTSVALQTRVAFTERKNAWIDVKNESAKAKFFEYLDQQELRNPSFVEEILNDLRENQSQAISRRTDLLLSLSVKGFEIFSINLSLYQKQSV
ncbi:Oidioi.mRNA.OKI2018_I69.chr2.g5302.t1.cds [Oikopleura dioica]|uniref:Oidioi.mRNA.OKI2018_I69.chr2.g5302.t1.cds n=1 Tax=Oikopleura dioica TaxID=34765 RepID=A0ABN7T5V2_OIKDI|nr:Oidioi.mRNA.OKI2018_I69.chr2.g5302.t1.cds [Oikopleura dioica]